jgi:hypothetical protein
VVLLESLVKKVIPDISEDDLYATLCLRAPDRSDKVFDELAHGDDIFEHVDKGDRKDLEKHKDRQKKAHAERMSYYRALAPHRRRASEREKTKEDALKSDGRDRGPVRGEGGSWTQVQAQEWCPPSGHIFLDMFNKRWRIRWSFGQLSRSFARWGFEDACLLCLQAAWESHEHYTGHACTVPHIFLPGAKPVAPEPPEGGAIAVAAAEPAAGRGGRGRGARGGREGRGGRARGGRGKGRGRDGGGEAPVAAVVAAAAVPLADAVDAGAVAIAPAAALVVPDVSGSSSSNSSSSSWSSASE